MEDVDNDAHYGREPKEQVFIVEHPAREAAKGRRERVEKVPRRGILGRLGLKKEQKIVEEYDIPEKPASFMFHYEFASPAYSDNENYKKIGNNTGQSIKLSLEITEEQAKDLSRIIEDDPKSARVILDRYMRETGDYGKWNAEIFDEDGNFHDPGERYGESFRARDVRPNYEAVPDLEPTVVQLVK